MAARENSRDWYSVLAAMFFCPPILLILRNAMDRDRIEVRRLMVRGGKWVRQS